MRQDPYKKEMFKKWLIPKVVGASIFLIMILIIVLIVSMNERTHIYNEGEVKSIPLLGNEKIKKLGDLYIKKQHQFEQEIMNMEINYANRTNKRGDKIYYGVNGKENPDDLYNIDYVNGIESIKYIKGKAEDRKDGESNFIDMVTFLSVALGSDIDRYSEEQLINIFDKLFDLTHTFTGESTELYPCEHGCSFCEYYCGDYMVQGEVAGNTVGFYKCDSYMGKDGEYGLMYDPFLPERNSNYRELRDMASDTSKFVTVFHNKGEYKVFANGDSEEYKEYKSYGRAVADDDDIFNLMEPDGVCEVCSYFVRPFRNSTKTFAGCNPELNCYHGTPYVKSEEGGGSSLECLQCMYTEKENGCTEYEAHYECNYEPPESDDSSDSGDEGGDSEESSVEPEPHVCENSEIGCDGYYECTGHQHYSCPGHIIVTCFGHTNLKLEIKIMYYEDMIDTIKDLMG